MTARAARLLPALLTSATIALTGCTDNPNTAESPAPTTTAAGTTTPVSAHPPKPTPPHLPPAANARTTAGLKSFAQHWIDAEGYAIETGDTGPFLSLSTTTCDWCSALAKRYRDVYKAGGHYGGGDPTQTIQTFQMATVTTQTTAVVEFRAQAPEGTRVATKGASPVRIRTETADYGLNLVYSAGRWRVTEVAWHSVKAGQ